MTATNAAKTVRPQAYPELEREIYRAADFVTERDTDIPPPSTQRELCVRSSATHA